MIQTSPSSHRSAHNGQAVVGSCTGGGAFDERIGRLPGG
jgi:hypothetical protein